MAAEIRSTVTRVDVGAAGFRRLADDLTTRSPNRMERSEYRRFPHSLFCAKTICRKSKYNRLHRIPLASSEKFRSNSPTEPLATLGASSVSMRHSDSDLLRLNPIECT